MRNEFNSKSKLLSPNKITITVKITRLSSVFVIIIRNVRND